MNILVMSDTHGDILRPLKYLEGRLPDFIIHAGDTVVDALKIQKLAKCPVVGVAGNWDTADSEFPMERVITAAVPLYLTHGHLFAVNKDLNGIRARSRAHKCPVAIYGHTHRAQIVRTEDGLILNPGSPTEPRGSSVRTMMTLSMELEAERSWKVHVHLLDVSEDPRGTVCDESQLIVSC